ncbi:hypothetical protein HQ308_18220 [Rhodococcus sp. BP-241]|uniref:hypothetical protein n=1 Tax=unclassified Rhodococcus (in: high G+C Gram-positive bacteria) TaxID=192944 RepID=UPI001C9B8A89|nr:MULTISPECIES: hypothetical protein [unclassified Rhodococcus (in: high G+C Gram-positive bacteria)]MBY6708733.1 hypothetical protein [Rhodococcus sp. BP-241]
MTTLSDRRDTADRPGDRPPGRLAGTTYLLRLALRTERFTTPVGVLVVPVLYLLTAASLAPLYPDATSRAALADGSAANAVFRILLGPLRDTSGIAQIAVWRVGAFALLVVAIIVAATVTRHLRGPEATGRMELVRAGAIGAAAPLAAAAITAMGAAVATGVSTGAAAALAGVPAPAATFLALQFVGAGLAATGVAAVVDQVVTTSRTAIATSAVVLLTAYLVRGIGDAVGGLAWMTWLSPLGWAERVDPLGDRAVSPFLACVALCAVGLGVAAAVVRRRDLGAGLVQPRPGPPVARWPISTLGVTVRTMGASLVPWMSGAFAYCLLVGLLTDSIDDLVGASGATGDVLRDIGGGSGAASSGLVGALIDTVLGIVAIAASAAAVSVVGHLREDDRTGRAEILLATAVSPVSRLLAAAATATVTATLVLLLAGVGLVTGAAAVGGDGPGVVDVLVGAVSQLPATLAVAAIAWAAYGFGSRWIAVGWAAVVLDLLLGPLGTLIGAPQWLRDTAPHTHLPADVGAPVPLTAAFILIVVATALLTTGSWALRRRDLV